MYKIQANASGTRSIEVSDLHLETLRKYSLLDSLVDSNGIYLKLLNAVLFAAILIFNEKTSALFAKRAKVKGGANGD